MFSYFFAIIMNKDKECPYLKDASKGLKKMGMCEITKDICPYIRYCRNRNRVVSSPLYTLNGCRIQEKYEDK